MLDVSRVRLYFASPLFNKTERDFNDSVVKKLELYSDVFLPQRDGLLLKDLIAGGLTPNESIEKVYKMDIRAIEVSDILVAVLDGRTIDEGVAFELGYAKALGKICIGLKTDDRVMIPSGDNPMIFAGCDEICPSVEDLYRCIQDKVQNLATG